MYLDLLKYNYELVSADKKAEYIERDKESNNMVNSYVQNRKQPSIEVLFRRADLLEVEAKELIELKMNIQLNE